MWLPFYEIQKDSTESRIGKNRRNHDCVSYLGCAGRFLLYYAFLAPSFTTPVFHTFYFFCLGGVAFSALSDVTKPTLP